MPRLLSAMTLCGSNFEIHRITGTCNLPKVAIYGVLHYCCIPFRLALMLSWPLHLVLAVPELYTCFAVSHRRRVVVVLLHSTLFVSCTVHTVNVLHTYHIMLCCTHTHAVFDACKIYLTCISCTMLLSMNCNGLTVYLRMTPQYGMLCTMHVRLAMVNRWPLLIVFTTNC